MNKFSKDQQELLYILGVAFVEIRATEDINKARILADIFHNVPAKISNSFQINEIVDEVIRKAERHKYKKQVDSILSHADERFIDKKT